MAALSGAFAISRIANPARQRRWNWSALVVIAALLAAFWPVWLDYVRRIRAGIDEPWGLVALGTAIAIWVAHRFSAVGVIAFANCGLAPSKKTFATTFLNRSITRNEMIRIAPVWLLIAFYTIARLQLPPLAGGICAVLALGLLLSRIQSRRRVDFTLCGLLLLSLPLSSALQFYLGYPMRYLTAAMVAPLLRMTGFAVSQAGTVLNFDGQAIWIDAPCSGVKMLWTGIYLSMALAALYRLGNLRTLAAAAWALVVVVLGNVSRSAGLFYLEAGILHAPKWAHEAIGIVAFAMTALGILWGISRISGDRKSFVQESAGTAKLQFGFATLGLHLAVCIAAAVISIANNGKAQAANFSAANFPGWPSTFEGRKLVEQPLAEREKQFLLDFPGKVAKVSDGRRELIVRWTNVATRKLHLSSDCFRGAGFTVTPMGALATGDPAQLSFAGGTPAPQSANVRYSRFIATRCNERLRVSEQICDEAGNTWPDASSWFWAASFGQTSGPWWGITIVEKE